MVVFKNNKYRTIGIAVFSALTLLLALTPIGGTQEETLTIVPKAGTYISIGDSVAAGVGLSDYADASACNRTQQSYPVVVANQLNYEHINVACGGATILDGLIGSQVVNKLALQPQMDTLKEVQAPNLVTLTIGANDIDWVALMANCYAGDCNSASSRDRIATSLSSLSSNLGNVLNLISELNYDDQTRVLVTGYYDLFSPDPLEGCRELTGLTNDELEWIGDVQDSLNRVIKAAADTNDVVDYIELNLDDHGLCSENPWVQGLGAPTPFHPTESGQAELARQIGSFIESSQEEAV